MCVCVCKRDTQRERENVLRSLDVNHLSPPEMRRGIWPQMGGVLSMHLCATHQILRPVQNASPSHTPLVAMVIVWSLASIWPALPGLRGLTLAREASWGRRQGLPRAVTQLRLGKGGEGSRWHGDRAELQGGPLASGNALVSARGQEGCWAQGGRGASRGKRV